MSLHYYSIAVALLNLWFILLLYPSKKWIFSSYDQGGYLEPSPTVTWKYKWNILRRYVPYIWILASVLQVINFFTFFTSTILLLITHKYFILGRYKSISRGLGAPGFFITWINFTNLLFIIVNFINPESLVLAINITQIELGIIFFTSGIFKIYSGYQSGRGMNIGLNNPQWGYFPKLWRGFTEGKLRTNFLDYLAVYGEIFGGLMLVTINFKLYGAALISLMFLCVAMVVRLGNLCALIIFSLLVPNYLVVSQTYGKPKISKFFVDNFLTLWVIIICLVYFLINISYYFDTKFSKKYKEVLNFYVQFFGISLWRVFTADLTSIYIEICYKTNGKKDTLISDWGNYKNLRFRFVGESIAVTSIFTLLKYQSSREIFNERILAHARSLDISVKEISYYYYYIYSNQDKILIKLVREFIVNVEKDTITELIIDSNFNPSDPEEFSRTKKNIKYGRYLD